MRILVTGGAGFIGSHTCDRLVALGHDVVVLDALTAPVHRDRKPNYLAPGVELFVGDVRNRDLVANLLRRVDAVYHFAAYQDYLPDFATFTDVNVTSTALLYEIIVAERLELSRVVVASSHAAMGEGLYVCPDHGEQTPDMRPESALEQSRWDLTCPMCGRPVEMLRTPERIANPQNAYGMSKHAEEVVAVEPRASIRDPDGCPPVQHRARPEVVGLQRILGRVSHLLPALSPGQRADPVRGRSGHPRLRRAGMPVVRICPARRHRCM
ncbi:MAG: NAD-dependent epimerase/dehydratase family protein [Nocardioidaceae bacterium]